MRNTADVTGGKPIAVLLQFISGVSAINPLVTFFNIHGGKREVLFFYFTTFMEGRVSVLISSIPTTTQNKILLFLTLIPLIGVGTTCFYHFVIKIRQVFYDQPPAWRQPSLKLE
jgi:hypothetical protein